MINGETSNRRELDIKLDQLEAKIEQLRVLYEQHYIDVLPLPPLQEQKAVDREVRTLMRAPFKNSQTRFRLRMVVQRYQTYKTYWERVNKQREEGTYCRDIFKAEMREKLDEEAKKAMSEQGRAEKGMRELFSTYSQAMQKSGAKAENLNFDAFKNTLVSKAKQLREQTGAKKLHYRIVTKNGKVSIKASVKK